MKALAITALMVAVTALSAQILRHAHLRWVQSKDSVLEKYKPSPQAGIKDAKSLAELEAKYAEADKKVKEAEEEAKQTNKKTDRFNSEPFKSERELKTAIQQWENRGEEIKKVRFFWVCGLLLSAAGAIIFGKCKWLGMGFVLAGFSQMIWWTSPSYSFNEASLEYQRMLTNKFMLSAATLALVLIFWGLYNKKCGPKEGKNITESDKG